MAAIKDRRVHSVQRLEWTMLKNNLIECKRCKLCTTRHLVALLRGSIPCNILFIGEAPGETENVLGSTMCGPTRRVMDTLMERVQQQLR